MHPLFYFAAFYLWIKQIFLELDCNGILQEFHRNFGTEQNL